MEKSGKKIIGYTAGVFDLFHIGHVNHLINAKSMCDHLIVGVSTDKLIGLKNKKTVVPYDQRVEVVRSCKYVDTVISQDDFDRFEMWKKLKFDITFIGDDYYNDKKMREIEKKLEKAGVRVIYLPYTKNVSSTVIRDFLKAEGAWTKEESSDTIAKVDDFHVSNSKIYIQNSDLKNDLKKNLIELSNPKYDNTKVSVVIPVYEPEQDVFNKLKENLRKQTIPVEIIEKWNNPEAISMNLGIKEAKTDIVVILAQDCIPKTKHWLEKLVSPLESKEVVATVSDLLLPEEHWKKYDFLLRLLIINERNVLYPDLDIRACAFRKKDLVDVGMINEENRVGMDTKLYMKLRDKGKIVRANEIVLHLHNQKDFKNALKKLYDYSKGNGKMVRKYTTRLYLYDIFLRITRALPFFGLMSIIYRFPLKKYFYLLPFYITMIAPAIHVANVIGFWRGFFSKKED